MIVIVIFFLKLSYVSCEGKGEYECGKHGRFEYCIDEIPGCIIGCHCHPGYYFDTDTKICEPNSKLIEHHRRSNMEGQTSYKIIEPISTVSKIDGEVDGISKDAEDLGDWLYNQFFKTIENQVVNKTSDKNVITRRSNLAISDKNPKRKKKIKKGRGSKRNRKRGNIKKKLLRITENDSLFDVSSSSSSSGPSSSDSSDSSFEYSRHYDDDDEHGHKKIVMIKKKPKRPLPNFIFLPNMETPFYPPISLPPPPVAAPMYPMVPVPPLFPYFLDDDSDEKITATANKTTTEPTKFTTTEAEKNKPHTTDPSSTEPLSTKPASTGNPGNVDKSKESEPTNFLRNPSKKRKKNNQKLVNDLRFNKMSPNRQKFLQYLTQKLKNQHPKPLKPLEQMLDKDGFSNTFIQNTNFESQYPNNAFPDDTYLINDIKPPQQGEAPIENVDFKYLTELIHKVDLNNKSNDLPPIEYSPLDSLEAYQPSLMSQDHAPETRRLVRPNHQQPDESYYMNLGRQIASMIRGIDTQNKDVDIKLEASRNKPKNDLFVNVNSPRSYWERSVRSPITFLKSNKNRFEYFKRSNELLFDIENKVEIIASTTPTLSLREIENVVKVMEKAKENVKIKANNGIHANGPKSSATNHLNIKLWPREQFNRNFIKNSMPRFTQSIFKQTIKKTELSNDKKKNNNIPNNAQSLRMLKINRFAVAQKIQTNNKSNLYIEASEKKTKIKPVSYFASDQINYYKHPQYGRLNKKATQTAFLQQNLKQPLLEQKINPLFLNRRKYFENDSNYFVNPIENISNFQSNVNSKKVQPSYFQHEINIIDYMPSNIFINK